MKLKFGLLIGLMILLLAGCSEGAPNAKYFSEIKTLTNVKVVKVDTVIHGKTQHTRVKFLKDGKTYQMRFNDAEDLGFQEYYESAKLFKDDVYINIIFINRNDEDVILAAGLSNQEESLPTK
jgi:hypothetical protein